MQEQIKRLSEQYEEKIIELRRQIHQNPELALEEHRTAALVSRTLKELGITVQEGVGKTGVVGLLEGKRLGKTVALRADMDALPIQELNDTAYCSKTANVMHACGHDGHTAMLLGAASILVGLRDSLQGNVKFIFQPSEESAVGGAVDMISEGVLENPRVSAMIGLHVDPNLPSGTIGLREGPFYAAGGGFEIELFGKGGHGARPHQAADAILAASELVLLLQSIASSSIDPLEPFVLTVGTIEGGSRANIISDYAKISGTFRFFDECLLGVITKAIEDRTKAAVLAHGAEYSIKLAAGGKPLWNDPEIIGIVRESASSLLGKERVVKISRTLLGEDFALYSHQIPAAFLSLGTSLSGKPGYPLHHARFDIDEGALKVGSATLAAFAVDYLRG